jgi:hypothetical protein
MSCPEIFSFTTELTNAAPFCPLARAANDQRRQKFVFAFLIEEIFILYDSKSPVQNLQQIGLKPNVNRNF